MKENNLFASVIVFRELYDNNKDIYDVISEFIISAISYQNKWSFNSTEITNILDETFDFNIPEAVVKTTIKNRLLKENVLSYAGGLYIVNNKDLITSKDISNQIETNNLNYRNIIENFILYFENTWNRKASAEEITQITDNLHAFITDNGVMDKYSRIISSYIIQNQKNELFREKLNAIKEGLILYNGIRYTDNLNELGTWNANLTIFLDTEHLFNAVGLNGILYKQIFDDFYNLVKEINRKNKAKNLKSKIDLRFFPENKIEIDNFFYVGEWIILGKATLDPSKSAMLEILDGCKTPSDILTKKTKFYNDLTAKGIVCDTQDYNVNPKYNVEDSGIIESLKKISDDNKRSFDEDECYHILHLFSKINVIRRGISNNGFEKIGAILMSGKSIAHFIAHNKSVKFNDNDIPFATNIDFMTNKFWFKLKKGLSNKNNVPKAFDIITKAQVVLSSQINDSVSAKYSKMTSDFKTGIITKDEASSYHHELRSKVRKPEEIVPESIDDSITFLNDKGFDTYIREKSILKHKVKEGEDAIRELQKIKKNEIRSKISRLSKKTKTKLKYKIILINISISVILCGFTYVVYLLISPNDTIISIIGLGLTIILESLAYYKYVRKLINNIRNKTIKNYKRNIETL